MHFTFDLFSPFDFQYYHEISSSALIVFSYTVIKVSPTHSSHTSSLIMICLISFSYFWLNPVSVWSDQLESQLLLWSHTNSVVYIGTQLSSGQVESPRERGKSARRRLRFQQSYTAALSLSLSLYLAPPLLSSSLHWNY